jgi:hypothetical protein
VHVPEQTAEVPEQADPVPHGVPAGRFVHVPADPETSQRAQTPPQLEALQQTLLTQYEEDWQALLLEQAEPRPRRGMHRPELQNSPEAQFQSAVHGVVLQVPLVPPSGIRQNPDSQSTSATHEPFIVRYKIEFVAPALV